MLTRLALRGLRQILVLLTLLAGASLPAAETSLADAAPAHMSNWPAPAYVAGRLLTLEGSVQRPAAGVVVELYAQSPTQPAIPPTSRPWIRPPYPGQRWITRTNLRGEFLFIDLLAGSYLLVAYPNNNDVVRRQVTVATGQRLTVELISQSTLPLPPEGYLDGHITRASNGNPVPAAEICLARLGEPTTGTTGRPELLVRRMLTGSDGAYRFEKLPAGGYHLSVRARGLEPTQVDIEVTTASQRTYDFALNALAAAAPGALSGRIYDAVTSAPLPGSRVYYRRLPASSVVLDQRVPPAERQPQMPAERPDYAVADQDGAYRVGELIPGRYHLLGTETRYNGCETRYTPMPAFVTIESNIEKTQDFPLRPRPDWRRGSLHGRIHNAVRDSMIRRSTGTDSSTLAGARVLVVPAGELSATLDDEPQVILAETLTDANGAYQLDELPVGPAEVVVLLDGFRVSRQAIDVQPDRVNVVENQLQPIPQGDRGSLRGLVRGADQQPLAGAMITLTEPTSVTARLAFPPNEPLRRVTLLDGTFNFGALPAGNYIVHAEHPRHLRAHVAAEVVANVQTEIEIALEPRPVSGAPCQGLTGVVEGIVVDVATSTPLAGAIVKVSPEGLAGIMRVPRVMVTNAFGRYRLDHVPVGPARVMAGKPGYTSTQQRIEVTTSTPVVANLGLMQITRTGVLEGQVLDALTSAPLAGATICLAVDGLPEIGYPAMGPRVQTDAAGRYRLTELPAGPKVVIGLRRGYWPDAQTITVDALTTTTLDFRLLPRDGAETTVTVQVLEARSGRPIPMAAVQLELSPWLVPGLSAEHSHVWCDRDGRAVIRVPAGTWPISACSPRYLQAQTAVQVTAPAAGDPTTKAASTATVTLRLELDLTQNAARNWQVYE